MKRARFNRPQGAWHPEDVKRLRGVANDRGYLISMTDAEAAWDAYSDTLCAGWLGLDSYSDEELWGRITPYLAFEESDA